MFYQKLTLTNMALTFNYLQGTGALCDWTRRNAGRADVQGTAISFLLPYH
jgi:hypothetical protein